jgi:hypothetical protein
MSPGAGIFASSGDDVWSDVVGSEGFDDLLK